MNLGTLPVDTFKLGATQADKIMLGASEVWTNAAPPGQEVFTASGTFTPKQGHTEYYAEVLGGGGSGGQGSTYEGGLGGGAASLSTGAVEVFVPTTVEIGSNSSFMDISSDFGGNGGCCRNGSTEGADGESSAWGSGGAGSTGDGSNGGVGSGGGGSGAGGSSWTPGSGGRGEVRISWGGYVPPA